VFDTKTNRILSVSIADGQNPLLFSSTYSPADWYMLGGASAGFSGNAIRLYGGSNSVMNGAGFDNIWLNALPEPAGWALALPGLAALCYFRIRRGRRPVR